MRSPLRLMLPLMRHWSGALSLAASRLPRRHSHGFSNSLVHNPRRLGFGFLVNVIERVAAIGQGQAFRYHPSPYVLTGHGALGNDALVAVAAQVLARHRTVGDPLRERVGRVLATLQRLAIQAA